MRLPSLSRGVLTDCRPYQNIPTPAPVKMAGGTHISSFAQGTPTPTPFNPVPVPSLLNASPIQHQFSPSSGAQPATLVSSLSLYSQSLSPSPSCQSVSPPSVSLTSAYTPIPAKLQPSSSSNMDGGDRPFFIVLDFDETITEEDTLKSLTRYAAHYSVIKAYADKYWPSPAGGKPTGSTGTAGKDGVAEDTAANPRGRTPAGSNEELGGPKTSQAPKPSLVSATSLLRGWRDSVLAPYEQDLKKFESEYHPPKKQRFGWEQVGKYLESLREVEERSIKRVEKSPIFKGFNPDEFRAFGRQAVNGPPQCPWEFIPCLKPPPGWKPSTDAKTPPSLNTPPGVIPTPKKQIHQYELTSVKFRKGFKEFTKQEQFKQGRWKFGVLSVNWSQDFIEGVLEHKDGEVNLDAIARISSNPDIDESHTDSKINQNETHENSKLDINQLKGRLAILANHITPHPTIQGPPGFDRPLTTAQDKAEVFRWLRDHVPHNKVVYIGDSKTDVLCFRDADLSIIIAPGPDEGSGILTLRSAQYWAHHISEAPVGSKHVWARDFDEIIDSGYLNSW